jgi:hypothetical protein
MPSAFPSASWSSLSRLRRSQSSSRSHALVEFRHPLEFLPARPSQPTAASQPLSWTFVPYSTFRDRGSTHAGVACPLCSALRVWLPSRRLAPREPAPALFHADSAPGIHPSKRSPFGRYPRVTARKRPRTVSLAVIPTAEATGRTGKPRFLGFNPSESPSQPNVCLARRPPDAPLGFALLGSANRNLARDFARSPLTRLHRLRRRTFEPTPRLRVSISFGLTSSRFRASTQAGRDNPSRVFVPAQSLTFKRAPVRAMSSPRAAPYVAADWPTFFGRNRLVLPESQGSA